MGFWNTNDPRHPEYEQPQRPSQPSSPYPNPAFGSPRIKKFLSPKDVREEEDPAGNLEPSTSKGKNKDIDILTAGIYHTPTLQGINPLTEEAPTGLMREIEERQGEVPLEGPPAAAIFATDAEERGDDEAPVTRADFTTMKEEQGGRSLQGDRPKTFAGDRKDSERFLEEFDIYWDVNRRAQVMKEPYMRVLMALSYFKGEKIRNWRRMQLKKIRTRVRDEGWDSNDEKLWKDFEKDFKSAYTNSTEEQDARSDLRKLRMTGGDLDQYVADHENLVFLAGYEVESDVAIEQFTEGLPDGLRVAIINRSDEVPKTYYEWKTAAEKEQAKWKLIKSTGLKKGGGLTERQQKWRSALKGSQTNQNKKRDPDAMDVDNVRLNPLTDEERKKFMQEGRCFRCRLQGHMSRDCPKKKANSQANQTEVKPKGRVTEIVDDRDDVSEAETEQTAVESVRNTNKKERVNTARINKAKMLPEDVAKAIGQLSIEEREAVLDAVMMQGPDF